ncbi:TMEM165/GDT1 family protein [Amphritea sp. HPY]|uniref:TMEM165/GDT1 family protein n=1 Tax=Amphritea sp. HPY TaxID=3421652 RepID=UPI003D7DE10E
MGVVDIASGAFLLVFLAEFGDKSQLVCMTLAARHRPLPILFGASVAFALLNLIAVSLGAMVAAWVPQWIVLAIVAALFLWFGVQSFTNSDDEDDEESSLSLKSLVLSAFMLIFLAEFGDKTQLAVAGLGSAREPVAVWAGATLALIATTLIGVLSGQALMRYISLQWLHRASGVLFIGFGLLAVYELVSIVYIA